MKPLFFGLLSLLWLTGCNESEEITPAEQDIKTFSTQLEGEWVLQSTTITPANNTNSVCISPANSYACDKLAQGFQSKDVVGTYKITIEKNTVKVFKQYTCSLPPEELSWVIEPDNSVDNQRNWMTGKNFTIKEINEANTEAIYSVIFFNLNNPSPDGKTATSATSNQLWLDVKFDAKESSKSFRLEFRKAN